MLLKSMKKNKKTLDNVEVGKSIEINGYDYQYIGKKVGNSGEIRGQECYVYVSQELKDKNQPYEKWFICNKTASRELKLVNFKYIF